MTIQHTQKSSSSAFLLHKKGNGPAMQTKESSFFGAPLLQPKLTIGSPNDKYEQEADQMADQVVQKLSSEHNGGEQQQIQKQGVSHPGHAPVALAPASPAISPVAPFSSFSKVQRRTATAESEQDLGKEENSLDQMAESQWQKQASVAAGSADEEQPNVQLKCAACAREEAIQQKSEKNVQAKCQECQERENIQKAAEEAGGTHHIGSNFESRLGASRNGGSSLPEGIQQSMGSAFGADFSGVRIHTNDSAIQMNRELQAQAFTNGRNIYFNQGKYQPESAEGQHLLAHELTHTIQQGDSAIQPKTYPDASSKKVASSTGEVPNIQGFLIPDFVVDAAVDAAGDVWDSGSDFVGDVAEDVYDAASDAVDTGVGLAEDAYDVATDAVDTGIGYAEDAYDVASDVVDAGVGYAEDAIDTGIGYAEDAYDTASDLVSAGIDTASDVIDAGIGLGGDALDLASEVVDKGLDIASDVADDVLGFLGDGYRMAQRIAAALGGSISISTSGIVVTLPRFCPVPALQESFTLKEMSTSQMVPIFALPLGPVAVTGSAGVTASMTPELQLQFGPLCFNGGRIAINPLTLSASVSGSVSATVAASAGAEIRGGLRGQLGLQGVIPIGGIPIPIDISLLGLEGGVAGMFRVIGASTFELGGSLSLSGTSLSFSASPNLTLGLGADLFAGAYAQMDLLDKYVCRIYWQPFEWHGGAAASIGLSLGGTFSGLGIPAIRPTFSLPTISQVPFDSIPLAITREGFKDDCPLIDNLCKILKFFGWLPSQNGGTWNWSGPYGPGKRLPGPKKVFQRDPGIPSGSKCRGACGPNCDTCKGKASYRYTDPDTGEVWEYTNYQKCNTNGGCREHDAAFDWAADKKGEIGKWAIVMPWHMAANVECACNNLAGNCIAWIFGGPPYDGRMNFADSARKVTTPAPPVPPGPTDEDDCRTIHPDFTDCTPEGADRDEVLELWGRDNGYSGFRNFSHFDDFGPGIINACDFAPGQTYHGKAKNDDTGREETISIFKCYCCPDHGPSSVDWRKPHPSVRINISDDEARRQLQESSQRIADLIRRRASAPENERAAIDRQIAQIRAQRAEALVQVAMRDNPNIELVDQASGLFRVPITDEDGSTRYFYGSIETVWQLSRTPPAATRYIGALRSTPVTEPGVSLRTRLALGGSGIQGAAQPFPGDLDYSENYDVQAPTAEAAARAVLETIRENVRRSQSNPNLESIGVRITGLNDNQQTPDFILNPANDRILLERITGLTTRNGNINTRWRTNVDGRFIEITKILSIRATNSATGDSFFGTRMQGEQFQSAYFENPGSVPEAQLGEYAARMRELALREFNDGHHLKAGKRAFNFLMSTGNLEGMAALRPAFRTPQARVNQQLAILDGIETALRRRTRTRILTIGEAREQMNRVAATIETGLPSTGSPSPREIASRLRALAGRMQGVDGPNSGTLKPRGRLARELRDQVIAPTQVHINQGVRTRVENVIERYVR